MALPAATARPAQAHSLSSMTDIKLERRLHALAWGEKHVLTAFLRHLDEFDQRRAFAPRGYPSLFRYCTKELGLSEDEAYLRIQAARLSREHPEILEMLAKGETHLSSLAKISAHIHSGNAAGILAELKGKSKREVERIAARFQSNSSSRDLVRALPSPAREPHQDDAPAVIQSSLRFDGPESDGEASQPMNRSETSRTRSGPGIAGVPSPEPRLLRIAFTASEGLMEKIERAKALLRHKHPSGRLEEIVDAAFNALLARKDPSLRPLLTAPRAAPRKGALGRSRYIPRWVRDSVWRRDGGRCAFMSPEGKRCGSEEWLEFDHIIPWALGGGSSDPGQDPPLMQNAQSACR